MIAQSFFARSGQKIGTNILITPFHFTGFTNQRNARPGRRRLKGGGVFGRHMGFEQQSCGRCADQSEARPTHSPLSERGPFICSALRQQRRGVRRRNFWWDTLHIFFRCAKSGRGVRLDAAASHSFLDLRMTWPCEQSPLDIYARTVFFQRPSRGAAAN